MFVQIVKILWIIVLSIIALLLFMVVVGTIKNLMMRKRAMKRNVVITTSQKVDDLALVAMYQEAKMVTKGVLGETLLSGISDSLFLFLHDGACYFIGTIKDDRVWISFEAYEGGLVYMYTDVGYVNGGHFSGNN